MQQDRNQLIGLAARHLGDVVTLSLEHKAPEEALVIYDTHHELTKILTEGYRKALPEAKFLNIDEHTKDEVIAIINALKERDLVVLVQSTNFRLDEFRIRLHLFARKLKVIEHTHLSRNSEPVWDVYINALAYDKDWYRGVGPKIKEKLAIADEVTIYSPETKLVVTGGVEDPKLNIGDYKDMDNIGGTFPIGEVFTESKDFSRMNGSFMIYAFAGQDFMVNMYEPFRVDIEGGIVTGWGPNTPQSFIDIIALIKTLERPLIRELGFGLNRAITRERYLEDITAFERIYGMHLSLGEKHSVYKKPGLPTNKTKFHIDLFPVVTRVTLDRNPLFENGTYLV